VRGHSSQRSRPASYSSLAPPLRVFMRNRTTSTWVTNPVAESVTPDTRRGSLVRDGIDAYQMRAKPELPDIMVGDRTGFFEPLVPPNKECFLKQILLKLSVGRCCQLPLTLTSTLSHTRVILRQPDLSSSHRHLSTCSWTQSSLELFWLSYSHAELFMSRHPSSHARCGRL